nr:organic cation transporter-like protein [Cherax quadricarinatus]
MGDREGQVLPCTHWSFNKTTYDNTLTSEFELVCDYDFLRPTYSSVYFFSACLAAPLSGWLSDRYGCKTMMSIGIVTYIILGNSLNWLPNISTILVLHFMMGLMHPTSTQTSYTLAMEICEPRLRSVVGIMVYLPWTLALVWWGGIAYLIRDWRWLLDESPRWLIVHGHHDRALKVLQKAARWNKVQLPPQDQLLTLMGSITREHAYHFTSSNQGLLAYLRLVLSEFSVLLKSVT